MKLNIRKLQIGGNFASLAVNYIPTSASTTAGAYAPAVDTGSDSSSKSSSKSSDKDELNIKDVLKVFDNVKGLPIDVQYVLRDFKQMFDDATLFSFSDKPSYSSLVNYYLNNIGKFNALGHSKELYDEARKELIANNSLDEIAIDRNGRIVVSTGEGIDAISVNEFKKGDYTALTNRELLNLRQTKLPFGDSVYNTMTGVGMDQIIKKINSLVQNLGSTERKIEGYSAKQSDAIKSGLAVLQDKTAEALEAGTMTVDGLYRNSLIDKNQKEQAQMAIKAVYKSLSPQEAALLALHGDNPLDLVSNLILSRTSSNYQFSPTLQASLNIDGSPKKTEKEKQEAQRDVNPLLMMQMMQGGEQRPLEIQTADRVETMSVPAKFYSAVPKANEGPISVEKMLAESGLGGILQGNGITFGDQLISRESLNSVMYDNRGGYMALLPYVTDTVGNKMVDLSILDEYKEVTRNIKADVDTPQYYKELAEGLKEKGLDELLTGSGTLNLDRFQQFFVFKGYTTDKVLGSNAKFKDSEYIKEVNDPSIADRMKSALSTKETGEFEIDPYDKLGIFEFWNGWDDIYAGTVYVPITPNQNSAYLAYGQSIKQNFADENETDYQRFNTKLKGFNPNNGYIQ